MFVGNNMYGKMAEILRQTIILSNQTTGERKSGVMNVRSLHVGDRRREAEREGKTQKGSKVRQEREKKIKKKKNISLTEDKRMTKSKIRCLFCLTVLSCKCRGVLK